MRSDAVAVLASRAAAHQHQGDEQGRIAFMAIDDGGLAGYDDGTAAGVPDE